MIIRAIAIEVLLLVGGREPPCGGGDDGEGEDTGFWGMSFVKKI
jgi:hypothetical protein